MGVTGLWKLIESSGKPVPLDTLEGKILAVDISIWLHQMIKGFQDQKGAALNNAHLLGLFHRLCKLMYYRIKPVFVFDGCIPQLKRDTIMLRQEQRNRLNHEADRLQALLLESLAKEEIVQNALSKNTTNALLASPLKKLMGRSQGSSRSLYKSDSTEDIFRLPEVTVNIDKNDKIGADSTIDLADTSAFLFHNINSLQNSFDSSASDDEDSSFEEKNVWQTYNTNLQDIDIRSKHFLALPADIRHEILVDLKETRKQSSWGRLHELPSDGNDFSSFQIQRLLKRHDVQVSLDEAEQELGGRSLTYNELQNLLSEDGILEPMIAAKASQKIHSDDKTRFLLVKNLKKKLNNPESDEKHETKIAKIANENSIENNLEKKFPVNNSGNKSIFDESSEDDDLKLAIARSLEEAAPKAVSNAMDYNFGNGLKLNPLQSKALKDVAKGPARSYMIEYGGMNDSEVAKLATSPNLNDSDKELVILSPVQQTIKAVNVLKETITLKPLSEKEIIPIGGISSERLSNSNSDSSSSDWEAVESADNDSDHSNDIDINDNQEKNPIKISITIDTKATPEGDDIFADIFAIPAKEEQTKYPNRKDKRSVSKEESLSILAKLKEEMKNIPNITLDDICLPGDDYKIKSLEGDDNFKIKSSADEMIGIRELSKIKNELSECYLKANKNKILKAQQIGQRSAGCLENVNKKEVVVESGQYSSQLIMKEVAGFQIQKSKDCLKIVNRDDIALRSGQSTSDLTMKETSEFQIEEKSVDCLENVNKDDIAVENDQCSSQLTMKETAELLKSKKTREELEKMAIDIEVELKNLENERNRQNRMGISITQRMNEDCQQLLQMFGIPYIVAPMEAEAQCAFLERIQLTQGTITDDSDIWLFGGHTVYKNFFAQNKHVMEFRSEQIEKDFHCDRNKLIQLACLVGSDYTVGIRGIGTVTALEILALFSSRNCEVDKVQQNNSTNLSCQEIFGTLQKFHNWWQTSNLSASPVGSSTRLNLLRKLKNIEIIGTFPNMAVIEAYLLPQIDESKNPFSWGQPDVTSIQEFTKQNFGWTTNKTNTTLEPILKRLNEKRSQTSMTNYFPVKKTSNSSAQFSQMSKRVQEAIKNFSNNLNCDTNTNEGDCTSSEVKTNSLSNKFKQPYAGSKPIQLRKLQKKGHKQNYKHKESTTSKNNSHK